MIVVSKREIKGGQYISNHFQKVLATFLMLLNKAVQSKQKLWLEWLSLTMAYIAVVNPAILVN